MARNEEVKITLSAAFEAKGVKQGASQVESALAQTEKAFEAVELSSKSLQQSLEKTGKSTQGFSKSIGKIKTPKGVKDLTKSLGKGRGGLGLAMGAASLAAGGVGIAIGAAAKKIITMGKESKAAYESMKKYEGGLKAIKQSTSGTTEQMTKLDGIIRDLGARTGEDIQDVADYVAQFSALGVGQKESTEAVTAALNVAKVEGKDASRVVSALMESYKGSSEQAKKLGLNVQGLTKEQLISGEAVDRIQEAYGETLTQAAQLTENEQETNRLLQETQEIKSKMWTQAEGLQETWDLIKLAIVKSKNASAKAFQPLVKYINRAVKMALNLRKTMKLSGAILGKIFNTVLAKATEGYAKMFDFLTGWSAKALSLIGVSVDVISNKLRETSADLYDRAEEYLNMENELRNQIFADTRGSERPSDAGLSGDLGGLSDTDTRVFAPKKEPKAKKEKEKKEKEGPSKWFEDWMDLLIKRAEEAHDAQFEVWKQTQADILKMHEDQLAKNHEAQIEYVAAIDPILDKTNEYVETQRKLYKELANSPEQIKKMRDQAIETLRKFETVMEFTKKEWKKEISDPFAKVLKKFAEATLDYKNAADFLIQSAGKGIKFSLRNAGKSLAKFGIGMVKKVGEGAEKAFKNPSQSLQNAARTLGKVLKNIVSTAISGSENIVAPSEIAAIDQSTKEGQLQALEATQANSQAGQDAAKSITSGLLSEISPVLGSLFESLLTDPEKLDAFFENLTAGFTIMVERIAENVGPIVDTLAKNMPRVVKALVKALPLIIRAVIKHLPKAVEILVFEIIKALPDIVLALVDLVWLTIKAAVIEIPRLVWKIFSGLGRGIGSLFGFGSSPSPPSSYEVAGIAPPPQNLDQFRGVQDQAAQIRKELGEDDDDDADEGSTAKTPPRIAPITIGGVTRTDQTLTAAEAFNPYVNEDFTKEAKQPVKIEIQIGDQRLREIITDLQETGYPTVVTA